MTIYQTILSFETPELGDHELCNRITQICVGVEQGHSRETLVAYAKMLRASYNKYLCHWVAEPSKRPEHEQVNHEVPKHAA